MTEPRSDREVADELIEEFIKMPNLEKKDIWGAGEGFSVADLIEDLRQLTPRGLRFVLMRQRARKRLA